MYSLNVTVALLLIVTMARVPSEAFNNKIMTTFVPQENVYDQMLRNIHEERSFDTILLLHQQKHLNEFRQLEAIYRFPKPKVQMAEFYAFDYKKKYNAEILVVIMMTGSIDIELMGTAARTLNFMRQARTLMVAIDTADQGDFKATALTLCESYKMTNVLLHFSNNNEELSLHYHQLKPYPKYHWIGGYMNHSNVEYYPQHWRNMHNGTVITYTDQVVPRSLLFEDAQGNLKLNGYVARLVLLFAEHYNAHMKMFKPLKLGEVDHFTVVNQMVDDNLVDIPMVLDISGSSPKWIYRSYVYDIASGMLIVPCAQPLAINEVFSVLLNLNFCAVLILCTVMFSIIHYLIDYLFDGYKQQLNFVFSIRLWPGVLGQSFAARNSPWRCLKLVYILLFFAGLNISTQFAATISTLFTSPPVHRQIETLADIKYSTLKIRVLRGDVQLMGGILTPITRSVIINENITEYDENRNNFNTSTGYYAGLWTWKMLTLKQKYFSHKAFCTYDNMTIFRMIPWTFLLQQHSQYKEPLDYLIHQVQAMGLVDAWYESTFSDLLKLKKMSLRDPNPEQGAQVLTVSDLHWAWMIVLIGLAASCGMFVLELWYHHETRFSNYD